MTVFNFLQVKYFNKVKLKQFHYLSGKSRCLSSAKQENEVSSPLSFHDIPGPTRIPFVGTLYKYLPFIGEYNADSLDKNAWVNWRKYGWLAREELLQGTGLLHVYHPQDVEAVFRQDDKLPARRSHLAVLHYRLGKPDDYNTGGLLATNGSEWWRLRSKFQKNFTHPQSVKEHIEVTDSVVEEFIVWLKKEKVTSNDDLLPYLNRLNLEIIGRVAFNEKFNSFSQEEQEPESRSTKTIKAAFESNSGVMKLDKGFLWRIFKTPLYAKLVKSQDYLTEVANSILINHVEFYEKENIERKSEVNSLLASFLEQSNLDLKDIRGMMVDILMAAIDTTAYSIAFALYHLANNRECQIRLYEEAVELLPNKHSRVTADVLARAAYTKCCVKESLRLNPVSIGVGRILQKDIVLRGYAVPKGTVIVTQNMAASRLPQLIKDPLKFNPLRWTRGTEEYENVHPFLSLPFGFGPRSCIARRLAEQNITITLLKMIRHFNMEWSGDELGVRTLLINKPDKPLLFSITNR